LTYFETLHYSKNDRPQDSDDDVVSDTDGENGDGVVGFEQPSSLEKAILSKLFRSELQLERDGEMEEDEEPGQTDTPAAGESGKMNGNDGVASSALAGSDGGDGAAGKNSHVCVFKSREKGEEDSANGQNSNQTDAGVLANVANLGTVIEPPVLTKSNSGYFTLKLSN